MSRRVRPHAEVTVSAVIPFFNHGMVVDEALEAVRRQSRPVDEIVVVDDGSTDPYSLSVLARLEDAGIAVVHQQNQGPGSARNLGVEHCRGDAILFLDSDDVVSDHHVQRALGALAGAPPEVGFVYPDMQFMGNEQPPGGHAPLQPVPPVAPQLLLHGGVDRPVRLRRRVPVPLRPAGGARGLGLLRQPRDEWDLRPPLSRGAAGIPPVGILPFRCRHRRRGPGWQRCGNITPI